MHIFGSVSDNGKVFSFENDLRSDNTHSLNNNFTHSDNKNFYFILMEIFLNYPMKLLSLPLNIIQ